MNRKLPPMKVSSLEPSGFEPKSYEIALMRAYDYCQNSVDHSVLNERTLQALFSAGVVEYFSVMRQPEFRHLETFLKVALSGDGTLGRENPEINTHGIQLVLHHHRGAPSDLVETYEFFKDVRNKVLAHKPPHPPIELVEHSHWLRVPALPQTCSRHPLYGGTGKVSYFKSSVLHATEDQKKAMCDLTSVTIQILWQRPDIHEKIEGTRHA